MVSVADIAEHCGLSVPRVMRILLAAGIPAERETEVPADLETLMSAFEEGAALMGEEAILAFTRVLGAAANNVAEAAIALFFAELGPGTERGGPDELGRARLAEAATTVFTEVPEVLAHLVMDAFERAQRRAQTARSWLGPVPSADDEAGGPTEVVALGFVDLVGSTAWAQTLPLRDQNLALSRFESAAWTQRRAGGRPGHQDDRRRGLLRGPDGGGRVPDRARGVPGGRRGRGAPAGPRGGGHRSGHSPGGRLLRAAREPSVPSGEGRRPRRGRGDRGGGRWSCRPTGGSLRPLEPAALRGIDAPVRAFVVDHRSPSD